MTTWAAQLFSQREGFGKPGAIPTVRNNPGDLRHAPGAHHAPGDPDGIGTFDTPAEGWAALDRQLTLYADRDLTLGAAINIFAPPSENNTAAYQAFIEQNLPGTPAMPMRDALNVPSPLSVDFDHQDPVY